MNFLHKEFKSLKDFFFFFGGGGGLGGVRGGWRGVADGWTDKQAQTNWPFEVGLGA